MKGIYALFFMSFLFQHTKKSAPNPLGR